MILARYKHITIRVAPLKKERRVFFYLFSFQQQQNQNYKKGNKNLFKGKEWHNSLADLFLFLEKGKKNKMVKPYTHLQSQGHVKKWSSVVASLMLIACSVAESIERRCFAFADPLWPCIRSRSSKRAWASMASISLPSCQVWIHNTLNIVRDIVS